MNKRFGSAMSAPQAKKSNTNNQSNNQSNILKPRHAHAFNEIPKFSAYTSPAPSTSAVNGTPTATTLPLNLIALIVSFLDDVGDLARVTRTSRLLHYMTLPQLYQRVHLHSYADIRYVNGKPEGFGSGSPFMMALNGLATKGHAALVHDFRVWGLWKETGVEDFAKGRVPDNSMMLNVILRASTDKMVKLKSFSWELDCKPLKTLYTGLSLHATLTSLTLRFPSARIPRPSVLIPPMANLRVFKAMDIDPMCYPDDISLLLLGSKKLLDVRLHFSPRMRQEAESVMTLQQFFGRCYKAGYKLRVKHFALQNFFGPNVLSMEDVIENETLQSIVFFDTFGGNDPRTIFVDETWRAIPPDLAPSFKRMRVNEISPEHIEILARAKSKLERLYLVNVKRPKSDFTPANSNTPTTTPSIPSTDTPYSDPDLEAVSLRQRGLETINQFHGSALTHLLLRDCWPLSGDEISELVRHCPNLEQLGLAVLGVDHHGLRLFMPFLRKLKALRLLSNEHLIEHLRIFSHEERMQLISHDLGNATMTPKIIGIGEFVYKLGGLVEEMKEDGSVGTHREVTFGTREDALKWDIWRLDSLDIDSDPIYSV